MKRLLLASLVSPALVLGAIFVLVRSLLLDRFGPFPEMLVLLAVPIAYVSLLFVGAPLLVLARRRHWLAWQNFAFGGILSATPAALIAAFGESGTVDALNGPVVPVVSLGVGVAVALLIWALGVNGNRALNTS